MLRRREGNTRFRDRYSEGETRASRYSGLSAPFGSALELAIPLRGSSRTSRRLSESHSGEVTLEVKGAEGVEERSWVLDEGAAEVWRVLGATISSVAEVRRRAGDAEGDVESEEGGNEVSLRSARSFQASQNLTDGEANESRPANPAADAHSLLDGSRLAQ